MAITSISGITSYSIKDIFKSGGDNSLIDLDKQGFHKIQSLVLSNTKLQDIIFKLSKNPHFSDYDIHISTASPNKLEEKANDILHSTPNYLKDFRDVENQKGKAEITNIVLHEGKNIGIFCSNILSGSNAENLTNSISRVEEFLETGKFQPTHLEFPQKPRVEDANLRKLEALTDEQIQKGIKSGLIKDIANDGLRPFHKQSSDKNKRSIAGNIATVNSAKGDTIMFQYLAEQRVKKGDIVFYNDETNNHNYERLAKNGGLLLQIAIKHGIAGLITQGDIRDIEEYAERDDFPVFAKEHTPNGPTKTNSGSIYAPVNWGGKHEIHTNDVCLLRGYDKRYVIPQENVDRLLAGDFSVINNKRKFDEINNNILDNKVLNIANIDRENKYKEYQASIANSVTKTNNTGKIPLITHQTLSKDILEKFYNSPTAEVADALSTRDNYICGFTTEPKHMTKLSGISVVMLSDNKKDIISKINKLKPKDVLVLITENTSFRIDEDIIRAAHNKKIAGIISNSNIDTPKMKTEISLASIKPQYVTHIDKDSGNVKIQNIPVNTGYIISSDPDGTVCIPPELIQPALIGIDKIKTKEASTVISIDNGTAKNKELPRGITKLNGHLLGYKFAAYEIASQMESTEARGSSNLVIKIPDLAKAILNIMTFKKLTHKQILEEAKPIPRNKSLKGMVEQLIIQDGADSPAFKLKTSDGNNAYITDIDGSKFNELSLAQEKKKLVTIKSNGEIKIS